MGKSWKWTAEVRKPGGVGAGCCRWWMNCCASAQETERVCGDVQVTESLSVKNERGEVKTVALEELVLLHTVNLRDWKDQRGVDPGIKTVEGESHRGTGCTSQLSYRCWACKQCHGKRVFKQLLSPVVRHPSSPQDLKVLHKIRHIGKRSLSNQIFILSALTGKYRGWKGLKPLRLTCKPVTVLCADVLENLFLYCHHPCMALP